VTVIWLATIGVLVLIELLTYGLYFAALAVAAVVPLILSLLGFDIWVQGLGFLVASILTLVFVRPLITKWQGERPEKMTNVAAMVGKPGIVLEQVTDRSGVVKVWGEDWTARSTEAIEPGEKVVVEQIDGASLIVRREG
jgi:membrane protein implicated in regulation of membrane protease activity